jgi:hypothetical protein
MPDMKTVQHITNAKGFTIKHLMRPLNKSQKYNMMIVFDHAAGTKHIFQDGIWDNRPAASEELIWESYLSAWDHQQVVYDDQYRKNNG